MIKQTDNATFPPCVGLISAWKPSRSLEMKPFLLGDPFLSLDVRLSGQNFDIYRSEERSKGNITY